MAAYRIHVCLPLPRKHNNLGIMAASGTIPVVGLLANLQRRRFQRSACTMKGSQNIIGLFAVDDHNKKQKSELEFKKAANCSLKGSIRAKEDFEKYPELDEFARFAVEDHNKKQKSQLEFKKLTKVMWQVVEGAMYYLTMEVADGGQKKVYKAKVWVRPWLNFKEVVKAQLVGSP